MSDKKRLELCVGHKQEWKQSHYADHNCDYCKLERENAALIAQARALESALRQIDNSDESELSKRDKWAVIDALATLDADITAKAMSK